MSSGYAKTNIDDVEDAAPKFGMGDVGEARYVREDVGAQGIGITHYRMNPGKRTGFGHRHRDVEEMYVVLAGSGRVKVDDEVLELRTRDSSASRPRPCASSRPARTAWSSWPPARTATATASCSRAGGPAEHDAPERRKPAVAGFGHQKIRR